MNCELCTTLPGVELYADAKLRVILVDNEPDYPGFCRVIWREHVAEMSDLVPADRQYLMDWVWRVEAALRATLNPDKINLASLGNVVPHLHWHVIPRFADDAHFPAPVWAAKKPAGGVAHGAPDLAGRLRAALAARP
ncbi:HIT family protein [Crenobacter luteus]|uniref:HIT family hydrolase n=1 Tax=Crenobacter luteus TaxID=1452487 RepID=A0A161SEB6_9NEIS|nr:HIT domain-containing protein [Crenobacter luteus]KZE34823.1 HIT family hydrolase [Crenobacter luteus]